MALREGDLEQCGIRVLGTSRLIARAWPKVVWQMLLKCTGVSAVALLAIVTVGTERCPAQSITVTPSWHGRTTSAYERFGPAHWSRPAVNGFSSSE
jgi:hypothetical protein